MLIKRPSDIRNSEITDRKLYLNRREFLQAAAGTAAAGAGVLAAGETLFAAGKPAPHGRKLENVKPSTLSVDIAKEKPNAWEQITTYNNDYEFGVDKDSPSLTGGRLNTSPWTVQIDGECLKTGDYAFDDLLKEETLEARICGRRTD